MSKLRVVHYINQFFANIGGEEKADYKPELREGNVGPGLAFQQSFGEEAEIVATVICGDSYFNENVDSATATVLDMIKSQNPDLVICGPAFNAGRYGVACGTVAAAVKTAHHGRYLCFPDPLQNPRKNHVSVPPSAVLFHFQNLLC